MYYLTSQRLYFKHEINTIVFFEQNIKHIMVCMCGIYDRIHNDMPLHATSILFTQVQGQV